MVEVQRLGARGAGSATPARGRGRPARRSPDRLLRDAWWIHDLLADLDADDHVTRARLLSARDEVRLEAAQQWHERGWRPITEAF